MTARQEPLNPTVRRQLREALEASENAAILSCWFFACPGPDKPFVSLATCYVCRTTQLLRRALEGLGLTPGETAPRSKPATGTADLTGGRNDNKPK